ncbi:MAG: DUF5103 domain-containing protein [Bacteroidales bacterium]|nr:DUF5103 domain-containing protein [Bacteroidales bacterium]
MNRFTYIISSLVLLVALAGSLEAQPLFTGSRNAQVKTVQVVADSNFLNLPVIDMEGNVSLDISFDVLADEQPWVDYTIVHCNARWEPDDLSEMDFLDHSHLPLHVENVTPSFNTFLQYYHYAVEFPNEEVRPTVSGNYAILFHWQDEPDSVVAVACFMVSEQAAFVTGDVSANTDIDFHAMHQQVTMSVAWSDAKLPNLAPADELKVKVQQNRRRDNERWLERPTQILTGRVTYEHQRQLIFEAGNHWRRFEFTDERYPGIGIDHIRYHAPVYYAYLNTDRARNLDNYRYDQDQHGRFLVHALHVDDETVEAEYFYAMFTLDAPQRLDRQGIYLVGDFTSQVLDATTRMEYDLNAGRYYKEVLLKQGAYNYQYLVPTSASDTVPLTTAFVEGNHYETPNEYQIFVYYRPFGSRFDRLLGVATLK